MNSNAPTRATSDPAEAAIARVLLAEREARESIEHARLEVEPIAEERACRRSRSRRAYRTAHPCRGRRVRARSRRAPGRDRRRSRDAGDAAAARAPPSWRHCDRAVQRAGQRADRGRAVIECGSLEYAQARLHARHGQRADEAQLAAHRVGARVRAPCSTPCAPAALRGWLAGITAHSTAHEIEARPARPLAATVGRGRRLDARPVAARAGLVRGAARPAAAAAPGARRRARGLDARRRATGASCARRRQASVRAVLAHGPLAALAPAWPAPAHAGAGLAGRVAAAPAAAARDADDSLRPGGARAAARIARPSPTRDAGPGLAAARARCRRACRCCSAAPTLEPAAAFIHLALCALDLERLRGELLRRVLFARCDGGLMLRPRARPLVRDPRRARRRDAGARGAGAHRRGRARGARQRRAAGGARRRGAAARAVRRAVAALSRLLAATATCAGRRPFPRRRRPTLQRSLATIRAWAQEAEPVIRALQRGEAERAELLLWQRVLRRARRSARRSRASWPAPARWLRVRLFVCPPGTEAAQVLPAAARAPGSLASTLQSTARCTCWSPAAADGAAGAGASACAALKGSVHEVPAWLQADAAGQPRPHRARAWPRSSASWPQLARGARRAARSATTWPARSATRTACSGCCRTCARSRPASCSAGSPAGPATSPATRSAPRSSAPARARCCTSRRRRASAQRAAAARQPALGAAVRDLQPRAGHAVAQRGRPERAARDRRAADVRLHVRRRRPGPRHRRRRLVAAQALPDRAAARSPAGSPPPSFGLLFGSVFSLHGVLPALWIAPARRRR